FISYASEDSKFVEQLRQDLERHGMKCWVATDDLQTGQKFRQAIDDAIQKHGLVLVVLSSSSIKSSWVEKEVETAMELERRLNRTILLPIRLDEAPMTTDNAWAGDIRRMRQIADFSRWTDASSYYQALTRLVRDVKERKQSVSAPS